MYAKVHASKLMRNPESLEHMNKVVKYARKLIKHTSFIRVHEKKAIHSRFSAQKHQVRNELYCMSAWILDSELSTLNENIF